MNIFDLLIVQPIFNLLMALYSIVPGGDIGVTIVLFTIIMRTALYPLTKQQLHQTRIMRSLQPQLRKIKKAAKGNRQTEALYMMDLYKRHGISPFRPLKLLLIQLPIFLGLFFAIRILTAEKDKIASFTYDALEGIGNIASIIANPDSLNKLAFGFIDITHTPFSNGGLDIWLFILVILAGVTQYIMVKQTTPSDGKDKSFRKILKDAANGKEADQAEINAVAMNKMIKIMPIMISVVMLTLPGAIVLYYTISNVVATLQQRHILKQDFEEMDDLADEVIAQKKDVKKTTKTREKKAKEANITRIVAKDKRKGK